MVTSPIAIARMLSSPIPSIRPSANKTSDFVAPQSQLSPRRGRIYANIVGIVCAIASIFRIHLSSCQATGRDRRVATQGTFLVSRPWNGDAPASKKWPHLRRIYSDKIKFGVRRYPIVAKRLLGLGSPNRVADAIAAI
jgi:hypothetical protein